MSDKIIDNSKNENNPEQSEDNQQESNPAVIGSEDYKSILKKEKNITSKTNNETSSCEIAQ